MFAKSSNNTFCATWQSDKFCLININHIHSTDTGLWRISQFLHKALFCTISTQTVIHRPTFHLVQNILRVHVHMHIITSGWKSSVVYMQQISVSKKIANLYKKPILLDFHANCLGCSTYLLIFLGVYKTQEKKSLIFDLRRTKIPFIQLTQTRSKLNFIKDETTHG